MMAISNWFKKSQEEKIEERPLRRQDETEEEEIPVIDQFSNAIHCGAKHIIINDDFFLSETFIIDVDDLILDGQGHIIEASGVNAPMFVITSNNVTIKNMTFRKGNASKDGGGAINNIRGTLNIIKCEFLNNVSHTNGGAIYNLDGTLNIRECTFENNHSDGTDGGAVYNLDGTANIDLCSFKGNSSKFGGAIYNGKTLNLKNTSFKNNSSRRGLSIFNTNDMTLKACTFERDDLKENPEIHNMKMLNIEKGQREIIERITTGGFIHLKSENAKTFKYLNSIIGSGEKEIVLDYDIINKEFKKGIDINDDNVTIDGKNNIIDGLGKGIFNINGSNITLKNINFRNGSDFEGGAINNMSDSLKVINCSFDSNISDNGGAISNDGEISLEKCAFSKNIANEGDGGAILNRNKLALSECEFKNNSSEVNGGAVNNAGELKIKDCNFESNHAKTNGASINNAKNASLALTNTLFKFNTSDKKGCVIYNDSDVEMEHCEFENNISTEFSNIIFQNGDEKSNLKIRDCLFSRDKFSNNLIFIENGSCDVISSLFKFRKERENSYALYNENGILTVRRLEFENIDSETIYNNNIIYFERDMEKYVKAGNKGLPFNYL